MYVSVHADTLFAGKTHINAIGHLKLHTVVHFSQNKYAGHMTRTGILTVRIKHVLNLCRLVCKTFDIVFCFINHS